MLIAAIRSNKKYIIQSISENECPRWKPHQKQTTTTTTVLLCYNIDRHLLEHILAQYSTVCGGVMDHRFGMQHMHVQQMRRDYWVHPGTGTDDFWVCVARCYMAAAERAPTKLYANTCGPKNMEQIDCVLFRIRISAAATHRDTLRSDALVLLLTIRQQQNKHPIENRSKCTALHCTKHIQSTLHAMSIPNMEEMQCKRNRHLYTIISNIVRLWSWFC